MPRRNLASLVVAVLAAGAFVACSDQSPVAPSAMPDPVENPSLLSQPVLGLYDLDFLWNGIELTLIAHIKDSDGNAAQGGAVIFQYCSYKGLPPNDISQPDEAPSSACADGSGTWVTLARIPVDGSGEASYPFGAILVVNIIGFRFRYIGQGSGIANWTIDPEDWTR
jgi:hypothetical protein